GCAKVGRELLPASQLPVTAAAFQAYVGIRLSTLNGLVVVGDGLLPLPEAGVKPSPLQAQLTVPAALLDQLAVCTLGLLGQADPRQVPRTHHIRRQCPQVNRAVAGGSGEPLPIWGNRQAAAGQCSPEPVRNTAGVHLPDSHAGTDVAYEEVVRVGREADRT